MANKETKEKVADWIVGSCLLAIFILALASLILDREVPIAVYAIFGGLALGADGDLIKSWYRGKK